MSRLTWHDVDAIEEVASECLCGAVPAEELREIAAKIGELLPPRPGAE